MSGHPSDLLRRAADRLVSEAEQARRHCPMGSMAAHRADCYVQDAIALRRLAAGLEKPTDRMVEAAYEAATTFPASIGYDDQWSRHLTRAEIAAAIRALGEEVGNA